MLLIDDSSYTYQMSSGFMSCDKEIKVIQQLLSSECYVIDIFVLYLARNDMIELMMTVLNSDVGKTGRQRC